jgi:hypothetical protein
VDPTAEAEKADSAAPTLDSPALDPEQIEELAAESLIDRPLEAPAPVGSTAPDQAIELASADISLEPGQAANATGKGKPVGPLEVRTERERQDEKTSERAKMWAEMRYRERKKESQWEEQAEEREWASASSRRLMRRTIVVILAATFLFAIGVGVYTLFFANRDIKLTAEDVWKEYAQNTAAANKKYKGRFVQVKGTVRIYKTEKNTQFFFRSPEEDAKWGILFDLRDRDSVKDGEDIIIRGRFTQRKEPDGNLAMSNCSIVQEK